MRHLAIVCLVSGLGLACGGNDDGAATPDESAGNGGASAGHTSGGATAGHPSAAGSAGQKQTAGGAAGSNAGGAKSGGTSAAGSTQAGASAAGSSAGGSKPGGSSAGGASAGGQEAGGSDVGGSDAGGSDAGGSDAGGSSAAGAAGAPDDGIYADPTCVGLTIDPWTRDAEGWTVLPSETQAGRRVIYVSKSNSGKTSPDPKNPNIYYVTTAEDGVAAMREGMPDSLLFNRGESFELVNSLQDHKLNGGNSIADAKVIGAYGTGARPVITFAKANSVIAVEKYTANYLIITQLDLEPNPMFAQQGTGITLSSTTVAHVLVEDVKINGFQKGMDIEDGTDVVVRRSQILNSCGGFRSQGIYTQNLKGFTLDEDAMDQNGLQKCGDPTSGSPQGQGVYVQSFNACFSAHGNVLTRSLGNTLEARIGGNIVGNVFIGSAVALNYGFVLGGSIEGKTMPRGVYGKVTGNVFLNNTSGVNFGNTAAALFSNNVLAATVPVAAALYLHGQDGIGNHGLTISDNSVSEAKYFISFQEGLPTGPVVLKNDGTDSQITNCDGTFKAMDASTNGVPVFKYESTTTMGKTTCYVGLEENGGDIYSDANPSVKIIDSALTGILMKPGDPEVKFGEPNALTGNTATVTNKYFEVGTTAMDTNPAPVYLPETDDHLGGAFVNPKASIADVLGTEDKFYAAMAAQSHDQWNTKITAAAIIPYFQAAYAPK